MPAQEKKTTLSTYLSLRGSHLFYKRMSSVLSMQVVVNASTEGHSVGSTTGFVGQAFPLVVPQAHLWSFEDPFLYDLDVTILSGKNSDGKTVRSI